MTAAPDDSRSPDSDAIFRAIFDGANHFIGLLGLDGVLLEVNQPSLDLLGLARDEVVGQRIWKTPWFPEEERPRLQEAVTQAAAGERVQYQASISGNGLSLTVEITLRVLNVSSERYLIAEGHDVTARKAAEANLLESEARYRAVVTSVHEGIVQQRADGVITTCNASAERVLGLSQDQMAGLDSLDPRWRAVHEDGSAYPGETHPSMLALKTGQEQRDKVMGIHKPDGTLSWILINSQPLFHKGDSTPYAVVSSFSDISPLKAIEAQLRHNALHDALTGLPARRLLYDRLEQAIARAVRATETLAVFFIDLDGFKPVNDTLGHDAGDTLLVQVARRLKACVREGDTVARLGGDEFVLVCEGLEKAEADRLAQRVLNDLSVAVKINRTHVSIGASLGVALFRVGENAAELLARADAAMYKAKRSGKAKYIVA